MLDAPGVTVCTHLDAIPVNQNSASLVFIYVLVAIRINEMKLCNWEIFAYLE